MFPVLVCCFALVALVAGGSSSSEVSALVVRLAGLPVLAWSLWRLIDRGTPPRARWTIALLALVALAELAQLIPLPPALWRSLPGGELKAGILQTAGVALPWLPSSIAPEATENALLGLVPAAAMACAVLTVSVSGRWWLVATIPLAALASIVLGALQSAGGEGSALRFYAITNRDAAVGFFANRNHQAALLAVALAVALALGGRLARWRRGHRIFWTVTTAAVVVVMLVGLGITRSRAGVMLAAPAVIFGACIVARTDGVRRGWGWREALPGLGAAALAIALVAGFQLSPLAARFETSFAEDLRVQVAPITARLAQSYAPLGAGAGAFDVAYGAVERPEMMLRSYVNHAHNDYLEVWLEFGYMAFVLALGFSAWWLSNAAAGMKSPDAGIHTQLWLGSLIIGLLLAHSIVDYPMRTPGLMVIFSMACGLCVAPVHRRAEHSAAGAAATRGDMDPKLHGASEGCSRADLGCSGGARGG